MESLFNSAASLRAQHHNPPSFNLFTVLRSASDELRLHSRFLAFLLDPRANHGVGTLFLERFLDQLGLQDFDWHSATVETEYCYIDIMIRNAKRQAIIIENKIYAPDQEQQLIRYVETLESQGYAILPPLYLTLHGDDADPKSSVDRSSGETIHYLRVSYASNILAWLQGCMPLVNQAALSESLLQYMNVVKQLTGQDQDEEHMKELKNLLLTDNNLLLVKDIQRAYTDLLKDLQLKIWLEIIQQIQQRYKDLPAPYEIPSPATIDSHFRNEGLYYELGFMPGYVYVSLNHQFYCGYYCENETPSCKSPSWEALKEGIQYNGVNHQGLLWRYTAKLNLKNPSEEDLKTLIDPERRKLAAEHMADNVYYLWNEARKHYENSLREPLSQAAP